MKRKQKRSKQMLVPPGILGLRSVTQAKDFRDKYILSDIVFESHTAGIGSAKVTNGWVMIAAWWQTNELKAPDDYVWTTPPAHDPETFPAIEVYWPQTKETVSLKVDAIQLQKVLAAIIDVCPANRDGAVPVVLTVGTTRQRDDKLLLTAARDTLKVAACVCGMVCPGTNTCYTPGPLFDPREQERGQHDAKESKAEAEETKTPSPRP